MAAARLNRARSREERSDDDAVTKAFFFSQNKINK
jgi:hypothetical protein